MWTKLLISTRGKKIIGLIHNNNDGSAAEVILKNGVFNEFTAFLKRNYPFAKDRYPVSVMIKSVEISEEQNDALTNIRALVKLDFYLENEGAIAKVYSAASMKQSADSNAVEVHTPASGPGYTRLP